jgi:hypothetical protein
MITGKAGNTEGRIAGGNGFLLWRGILDKVDSLLDISFEALDGDFKQLFLLLSGILENVGGILGAVNLYH